jgi:NTP pyrophosphatase (non-canonical NTP hydrolase)
MGAKHRKMRALADEMKGWNYHRLHSWYTILMEEVYEAFAETEPEKQREEMIQVAAVAGLRA